MVTLIKVLAELIDNLIASWGIMLLLGWIHNEHDASVPALGFVTVFLLIQVIGLITFKLFTEVVEDL